MKHPVLPLAVILGLLPFGLRAEVRLPAIFSDHMVLQKTARVPVWGWAKPGEQVKVEIAGQSATALTDQDGKWMAALDLGNAGSGPFEMQVSGENSLTIRDVLIGEVWLASGQSNMEFTLDRTMGAKEEIAAAQNPQLREFKVTNPPKDDLAGDTGGRWMIAGPQTAGRFSGVAYYFGKILQQDLRTPVGIVNASVGGTPVEAWTSKETLGSVPELARGRDKVAADYLSFPERQEKFAQDFAAWLIRENRTDSPSKDVPTFPPDAWTSVKLPGQVLSTPGVGWLRKEVVVPAALANKTFKVQMKFVNGYERVYWNGTEVADVTYQQPDAVATTVAIPDALVKEGVNTLMIRIFAPVSPVVAIRGITPVSTFFPVGQDPIGFSGEWVKLTEHEFPALSPAAVAAAPRRPAVLSPHNAPSRLFNSLIHPIVPYAIRGVIWYQGETNATRGYQYRTAFPLLIQDWRQQWGQPEMPFYFAQLAGFKTRSTSPDARSEWSDLREAQSMTLSLPETGQAVLIDVGEEEDIHPRDKKTVGTRLAAIALANTYGKSMPFSGPVFQSMKVEGGEARLSFSHTDGGLKAAPLPEVYQPKTLSPATVPLRRNSPSSELEGFALSGSDGKWFWADARIEGDEIVISSLQVPQPTAVRYAWADNPIGNLFNGAGFPASPFRTDSQPAVTQSVRYGD